jgi:transposase-like protein
MNNKIRLKDEISKEIRSSLQHETQNSLDEFLITAGKYFIEEALEEEVSDFLDRARYSRKRRAELDFRGYRNGYQESTIRTQSGRMRLKRPRVRQSPEPFESRIYERINALEENLKQLVLESYVRGLSTRDIEETFQDKAGKPLLSRTAVSKLTPRLNEEYEKFQSRDLSTIDPVYMFVDAVFESVRKLTNNQAIFCAWAITSSGEKIMLSLSVATAETTEAWSCFFEEMIKRGLRQPVMLISDGAQSIINAIERKFPKSDRQRCIAHKMRNILSKVPKEYQELIKQSVTAVYYAPEYKTAELLASDLIDRYSKQFPKAVNSFVEDLEACIIHLKYPSSHHKYIRTTNLIERAFGEEKRRTKVMPQHQSEQGAIGLVFAVLIRASEKWTRIKMTNLELTTLKNIRNLKCKDDNELVNLSYEKVA